MRASKGKWMMLAGAVLALSSCGGGSGGSPALPSPPPAMPGYLQAAALGIQQLQTWYDSTTGLWQTTGWWNAANSITVLGEYSKLSGSTEYLPVISNTFTRNESGGFLTNYYDDEGWWALAWIEAYDVTGNASYLNMAEEIFSDMTTGWDTSTCGGGIWWNKTHTYKNAIANELFLDVAANLAERVSDPSAKTADLNWAQEEWQWFSQSGMINAQNLINDGLSISSTNPSSCQNNGQTVWSYNQGVILGGLAALAQLTGNSTLLEEAQTIAQAAIAHLTDSNGILHDACEPNCGADGVQFKGIFVRNLAILNAAQPQSSYASFLATNAQSIWNNDQGPNHQFGVVWSGPFSSPSEGAAAAQTSAVDCFLAADEAGAQP